MSKNCLHVGVLAEKGWGIRENGGNSTMVVAGDRCPWSLQVLENSVLLSVPLALLLHKF